MKVDVRTEMPVKVVAIRRGKVTVECGGETYTARTGDTLQVEVKFNIHTKG